MTDNVEPMDTTYKITNTADAVDMALKYTGFLVSNEELSDKIINDVTLIEMVDTTTPFIHDLIDGRKVWKVPFYNIRISEKKEMGEMEKKSLSMRGIDVYIDNERDFDVYINAESGQLFKIIASFSEYDPALAPEPPYEIAEEQMRSINEKYLALPDSLPNVSFFDCLKRCFDPPEQSKEIIGFYVIVKDYDRDKEAFPAWIIINKGFPPDQLSLPPGAKDWIPVHHKNMRRNIFNAETGRFISADNGPKMPLDWKPDKR